MNNKIAVLLPSRHRTDMLRRSLDSIGATVGDPANVVVVVGVDDDDGPTIELSQSYRGNVPIVWSKTPRENTLMRVFNRLAETDHGCDILSAFADDFTMTTKNWDGIFRYAVSLMPKGYGTAWAVDPVHHGSTVCTAPVITRAFMEKMGFFMPPWFPFWFSDVWLEEMGAFIGCRMPLAAQVALPDGRGQTTGMREVAFWGKFFQDTRKVRVALADKLIDEMYAGNPGLQISLKFNLQALSLYYAQRAAALADPGAAAHTERVQNAETSPPSERYLSAKSDAEAFLESLQAHAV